MKNVSILQSNTQSSKTPGGISKSLLTPCRRVGLSRNWKKSGPSPFKSPLAVSGEVNDEKVETRKRKERVTDDESSKISDPSAIDEASENVGYEIAEISKPSSRSDESPLRKKSKSLLSTINKSEKVNSNLQGNDEEESFTLNIQKAEDTDIISTPVRSKSRKRIKKSPKTNLNVTAEINNTECNELKEKKDTGSEHKDTTSNVSPNDLKKECIVVIQKKAFKNLVKVGNNTTENIDVSKKENTTSQTMFDSDSDDTPLSHVNKKQNVTNSDDHFIEKTNMLKEKKDIKSPSIVKNPKNEKTKLVQAYIHKSSQSSYDDDDDFDDKKTILIRKTYEKVNRPQKAKSTGSITQKDIDELKTRIEAKKKLLLAESLGPETAELRGLIKKWQKGCQDALMELLDLMRSKFPDQNMGYSEMLSTLKIPASLVGYDSDSDCFNSPNDENIILRQFNDL